MAGLTQVLAFADAVGSFDGICKAACSQLQRLQFVVQLPEQVLELLLPTGNTYWFPTDGNQVVQFILREQAKVDAPLASAEQH